MKVESVDKRPSIVGGEAEESLQIQVSRLYQ